MRATQKYIKQSLQNFSEPVVIDRLTWILIEHITRRSYVQLLADPNYRLTAEEQAQARLLVDRLLAHEPIQYVLGNAFFYGLSFQVNRHTLIPRPETEELVERILAEYAGRQGVRLLDIGTGSGCIALTLAKHLPDAKVMALDVSAEALIVARENARLLGVDNVSFVQADILVEADWEELLGGPFDGIVSNPPYIAMEEQKAMESNVLDYEPANALFVPDDDPLVFYRAIALLGRQLICPEGTLYFEINARYGRELVALLEGMSYHSVELIRDLSGNDRMIKAKR